MLARNRAFARALAASVLATAALALVLGSVPGAPPALCVAAGALEVCGAVYDIATGRVEWL